ncbi:gliding motility-associated ABC transporter substrate-binding protein GldG [Arcticibacter eurypsychrophilus]|uniref:gliding motility-associated ABC transporter substrate-binding protein GldG n=1 Tax=Arcticibacter eurypsychrophilus TaxID=1434752 RepID=UPI00084E076F|nr:gliding motility-associated ABC transporter substrate-binding protein GldG [Arcticibacter eurypsychrophilus]
MVNRKKTDLQTLLIFLLIIIGISLVSSIYFTRIDFTADKRFTLSDITRSEMKGLDDEMQVTVYLDGDFPAGFKRLQNAVSDLLSDYKAYSGSKLNYKFINPSEGGEEQATTFYQQLSEKGLLATNLSVKTEEGITQKIIFPSALISYKGKEIAVNFLQSRMGASPEEVLNNSVQNLEYAFTTAIRKLKRGGKPKIGFTEGHDELTDPQLADAMGSLQSAFEPGRVNLQTISLEGISKLNLLVIPKPQKSFTELEKYKIDYFIAHGGSVLWAIDQVNAELDSLRGAGTQLAFVKSLNLDDMLFRYGVKLNYNLIADLNCAKIPLKVGGAAGQAQMQMVPWIYYPLFVSISNHPVVKNIDAVRSEFSGSIDTLAVAGIRKDVLLSSSPYSKLLTVPALISLQQVEQAPNPAEFKGQPQITAVAIEGVFPQVFKNRPVPEGILDPMTTVGVSKPAKMIVLSDGDMLKNQVSTQDGSPFPLGYDRYTQQQFGNKTFFLNAVDYLTDDPAIIMLRSKEVKMHLLDRARIKEDHTFWQLINIGLPLVLLVITGVSLYFYRKRKYS